MRCLLSLRELSKHSQSATAQQCTSPTVSRHNDPTAAAEQDTCGSQKSSKQQEESSPVSPSSSFSRCRPVHDQRYRDVQSFCTASSLRLPAGGTTPRGGTGLQRIISRLFHCSHLVHEHRRAGVTTITNQGVARVPTTESEVFQTRGIKGTVATTSDSVSSSFSMMSRSESSTAATATQGSLPIAASKNTFPRLEILPGLTCRTADQEAAEPGEPCESPSTWAQKTPSPSRQPIRDSALSTSSSKSYRHLGAHASYKQPRTRLRKTSSSHVTGEAEAPETEGALRKHVRCHEQQKFSHVPVDSNLFPTVKTTPVPRLRLPPSITVDPLWEPPRSGDPLHHQHSSGQSSLLRSHKAAGTSCCRSRCNLWELCQPVRCIVDQNEVEIIPLPDNKRHHGPATHTRVRRSKYQKDASASDIATRCLPSTPSSSPPPRL